MQNAKKPEYRNAKIENANFKMQKPKNLKCKKTICKNKKI